MAQNPQITKRKAQKVRKQKITAAVFGGIFLILVVVQGPKTLKMLHGSSSAATPAASSVSSQPATTTGTSTAAVSATSSVAVTSNASASLTDSDRVPERTKSQLVRFDTFDSKDPFVQQVSEEDAAAASGSTAGASGSTSPSAAGSGSAPSAAAAPTTSQGVTVPAGDTGGSTTSSTAPATRTTAAVHETSRTVTTAVVEVNGRRQPVRIADSFPKANPTFKLVALNGGVARVGVAGGSYASGAQTVSLQLGHTLTLVNTADGMRYELKLVSAR
jgi:hypothetical protein